MTVNTFETRNRKTSPKVRTVLGFATTTPRIPVTVDSFETRRRKTSPKVTTVLGFATTTPPIPVTVNSFAMRRRKTSPKVRTVLGFATTTPPIPVTVDTFVMRKVKGDDSSAFRHDFRLSSKSDASPTLRERLRTIANDCGRLRPQTQRPRVDSWTPDPWTPTLRREPFCYAFGKKYVLCIQMVTTCTLWNLSICYSGASTLGKRLHTVLGCLEERHTCSWKYREQGWHVDTSN